MIHHPYQQGMTMAPSNLHDWDEPQTTSPLDRARTFFAAVLVLFGIIIGGVLVYQVGQFLFAAHAPAMFDRIAAASADETAILITKGDQTQRIQLPPKLLSVIGGFFCIIALSITARLAVGAITLGARLLTPGSVDRKVA
jgi:hypothetical protein